MAFRTNKTPVLQTKSASGSVATFNTALAMPLSSCNIAVNAWQEGSGDPSPDNVRPIHGFSEVNLTANNVIHTIQLGQEVYGAEVDVVNGIVYSTQACDILTPDHVYYVYTQNEDRIIITCNDFRTIKPLNEITQICTHLKANEQTHNINNTVVNTFIKGAQSGVIYMKFDKTFIADLNAFMAWITSEFNNNSPVKVVYDYNDNFPLQTPQQIETLIGNNTIFADTGDTSLTYKDLDIAKRGNFREVFKLPS